jgi:hypothetical protein
MRVVVISGDKNWTDVAIIREWLLKLQDWGYDTVIEGKARGADTIAGREAKSMGFNVIEYPAEWDKYGKAAGPIRNRKMLDNKPQLVVAFHNNIEQSKGTKDCITEAKKRGIGVILVKGN